MKTLSIMPGPWEGFNKKNSVLLMKNAVGLQKRDHMRVKLGVHFEF